MRIQHSARGERCWCMLSCSCAWTAFLTVCWRRAPSVTCSEHFPRSSHFPTSYMKECTLNHNQNPCMIQGVFLASGLLEALGPRVSGVQAWEFVKRRPANAAEPMLDSKTT